MTTKKTATKTERHERVERLADGSVKTTVTETTLSQEGSLPEVDWAEMERIFRDAHWPFMKGKTK